MTESSGDFEENSTANPAVIRSIAQPESPEKTKTGGEIVTARGTADGLVLRIDNSIGQEGLKKGLWDYMESRRHFVEGNEIILEWLAEKPEENFVKELEEGLTRDFSVTFKAARPAQSSAAKISIERSPSAKGPSLFDGIEALGLTAAESRKPSNQNATRSNAAASMSSAWDDADARIVHGTLRSGQKIETEHSVVVFGDVNSGAEVIAGGDVIVLGILRGTAHAGAYDETGGGRVIFALNLQPTQLRIGSVISRGSSSDGSNGSELARVDGTMIVVEQYQSKSGATSKK